MKFNRNSFGGLKISMVKNPGIEPVGMIPSSPEDPTDPKSGNL